MKKAISVFLVIAVIISAFSFSVSAEEEKTAENQYPVVFVHGMFGWGANEGINSFVPYWGATTGNMIDYLREEGYDCYSASVGPLSSVWDQACELYAQLTGSRVDYGALHSGEFGHKRFGRNYDKPLFEGWGENGKKIHLVGHSFGGNAVRLLTYLLTYGCEEEMAACDDPSPLFEGGHEELIATCTAICTPINGTTAYNVASHRRLTRLMKIVATLWAATFGRSVANGTVVDFHLEQFGLCNIPGDPDGKADPFFEAVPRFLNTTDSVDHGLSIKDCKALNDMIETSEDVYYFSVAYDCTEKNSRGKYVPKNLDFILLGVFSRWIIDLGSFTDEESGTPVDESWMPNDGLVNVKSALYPFDEAHKDYDANNVEKGMWNVLPVRTGDHGTPIGLFADKDETRDFMTELLDVIIATEG